MKTVRERFEAVFPCPDWLTFDEVHKTYLWNGRDGLDFYKACQYISRWEGWAQAEAKILFREHRGTFEDSMATTVTLPEDKQSLVKHINSLNLFLDNRTITDESIIIEGYWPDSRNNWDTHIVEIDGYGVVGFTNKMPT